MKRKIVCSIGLITIASVALLSSCSARAKEDVTIVYTNDIHSYIANTVTNEDKTTSPGLRLSKISAMVEDMRAAKENVLLVDAGDEVQGTTYGSIDNGKSIIDLMNKVGYQLAVPGNHDFDYGVDSFKGFTKQANFDYVSCNFRTVSDNKRVLEASKIFEIGGVKIGFVGISTPETITTSTPRYFQDESGNYIYKFDGSDSAKALMSSVQSAVDDIKNKVDYVVALGHCGVGIDEERLGIRSIDVIRNTNGIDAFIDGHSHTTIECNKIKNKDGKDVVLTQTGAYLNAVGKMTISKTGEISTKLENNYTRSDSEVEALENALVNKVNTELGQKIGVLEKKLYVNNANNPNQRIIRAKETNMGDFVSDSIYWYFNESRQINCDVAIANGGGIRAEMEPGDLTSLSAKNVEPYSNMLCLIKVTGKQIIDCLECGVQKTGIWDSEWDSPAENGGFMHVAGMKYEVDASVKSSVVYDANKMFSKVDGDYRVKNVMIYNKTTKAYEALDKTKTYTLAGINYFLRNSGDGLSMFKDDEGVIDYAAEDYSVLIDYIKSFTKGSDNYPLVNNANSPLKAYANYLLDYENPLGAGRIDIKNVSW